MFSIGDPVRLNKGWTRMIVIGFSPCGDLIAKYDDDNRSDWYRVTLMDYENPMYASSTIKRPARGFTAWDGKPSKKATPIPQTTYNVTHGTHKGSNGTFLNRTSTGKFVLELTDGDVITVPVKHTQKIVPLTFRVKSVTTNYHCIYEAPKGVNIRENDLLLSNSGNLYIVTLIETEDRDSKGVFQGSRLVQESL